MFNCSKIFKILSLLISIMLTINSATASPVHCSLRAMSLKLSYVEQIVATMGQQAETSNMLPIWEVAKRAGIPADMLMIYPGNTAKVNINLLRQLGNRPGGRLINVTAITPTRAGEGKTCTTISLAQGLKHIGKKVMAALREPSEGPVFGEKGGAAGAGKACIEPGNKINLEFTGDIGAVTAAHNLLANAMATHLYYDNKLDRKNPDVLDPDTITFPRALDVCDRELRTITTTMSRTKSPSVTRASEFAITAASEIMAILALAKDEEDLRNRLGNIILGRDYNGNPFTAKRLGEITARWSKDPRASDKGLINAMATLLRDAIHPNLVQTTEGVPVLVHAGSFANIAHGNNSVIATNMALKLVGPDGYVVTEGGFGADLGAEKFYDIVARQEGYKPDLTVLVVTAKALKMHGGMTKEDAEKRGDDSQETLDALRRGFENLDKHIENIGKYRVPKLVAINSFPNDTAEETKLIKQHCADLGVRTEVSKGVAEGAKGTEALAKAAVEIIETTPSNFRPLYELDIPIEEKIKKIATEIYGADGAVFEEKAVRDMAWLAEHGFGNLPVCIAKTQDSLSDNPALKGRPKDWKLKVRGVKISGGAGFLVVMAGDIMLMPGFTKEAQFRRFPNPFAPVTNTIIEAMQAGA